VGAKKEQDVFNAVDNIQRLLEAQELIFYPKEK
jgi:hypothetical protein